jgi:hypothetical protein
VEVTTGDVAAVPGDDTGMIVGEIVAGIVDGAGDTVETDGTDADGMGPGDTLLLLSGTPVNRGPIARNTITARTAIPIPPNTNLRINRRRFFSRI